MNKEFIEAICALEKEKDISKDILIEAIESALVSAYKKNYGTSQNVRVNIDREEGDIDVFMRKDVVAEVEDDMVEIGTLIHMLISDFENSKEEVAKRVEALCVKYPLYR